MRSRCRRRGACRRRCRRCRSRRQRRPASATCTKRSRTPGSPRDRARRGPRRVAPTVVPLALERQGPEDRLGLREVVVGGTGVDVEVELALVRRRDDAVGAAVDGDQVGRVRGGVEHRPGSSWPQPLSSLASWVSGKSGASRVDGEHGVERIRAVGPAGVDQDRPVRGRRRRLPREPDRGAAGVAGGVVGSRSPAWSRRGWSRRRQRDRQAAAEILRRGQVVVGRGLVDRQLDRAARALARRPRSVYCRPRRRR